MQTISISDLSHDPSEFLRHVEAGEEVILVRDAQPVAEVKPLPGICGGQRPFGLCTGEFIVPDDFDAPLPEGVLQDFAAVRGYTVPLLPTV